MNGRSDSKSISFAKVCYGSFFQNILCWLTGFFLIFFFSRSTGFYLPNLYLVCFCLTLLFIVLHWKSTRFSQIFFFLGGLVWGNLYTFPSNQENVKHAIVFKKNPTSFGQNIVVEVPGNSPEKHSNRYYLAVAKGQASVGAVGSLEGSSFQPYSRNENFSLLSKVRSKLFARIEKVPFRLRPLLRTLILGDRENLPFQIGELFKKLGLFHLLVVSGLHVSFLCMLLLYALTLIPKIFYSLTWLNPQAWFVLQACLRVLSLFLIVFYSGVISFPPSVQRAVLLYVFSQVALIGAFSWKSWDLILLSLFFQSLLFPLDVFSMSSFLSWLSYFIVLFTSGKSFIALLRTQVLLCFLSISIFGQLSILGFFLNIYLVPFFPLVLVASFLFLGKGDLPDIVVKVCENILEIFLDGLENMSFLLGEYPLLSFSTQSLMLRAAFFLALSYFLCKQAFSSQSYGS